MVYSERDVFDYIEEEDVKFIRLTFCDLYGRPKNLSIMPDELPRAMKDGISFDASAIEGFTDEVKSDLFLYPIPSTLSVLPWRPSTGKVVRMFCDIKYADGTIYEKDSRNILKKAIQAAREEGIEVNICSEFEFYLFKTDENGNPTEVPLDKAGYMDVAPMDKGENVRREICLTLQEMGIMPETSHHEEGPGQNEIDFRYSNALQAADNAFHFRAVVKAIASNNGLYASFSPKPLENEPGSGMHVNLSINKDDVEEIKNGFIAGIMEHVKEMTAFLNPVSESYERLGQKKAPRYITWSRENRSQLIRLPKAKGEYKRMELRSPDAMANIYIAYALLIYAGLDGIKRKLPLQEPLNVNLYTADESITANLEELPKSLEEAQEVARNSEFIKSVLPDGILI